MTNHSSTTDQTAKDPANSVTAVIFNIERHALHDGPGIRTLIFVKGCPLRCLWCSNPEGQSGKPELLYRARDCVSCMRCLAACPANAIRSRSDSVVFTDDRLIYTDRETCEACGACVEVCPAGARTIAGTEMSAREVLELALRDEVFYRNSGGGVTVSGGEPLTAPLFLGELFTLLKMQAIHTAIETCGHVEWGNMEKVLDCTDLFLYDVKHMDPETHRRFTGVTNEIVLENLRKLDETGARIVVRVPLVTSFNDRVEEIEAIARLTMSLRSKPEIQLLPYHALGRSKYHHLEKDYPMERQRLLLVGTLEELRRAARAINPNTSLEI